MDDGCRQVGGAQGLPPDDPTHFFDKTDSFATNHSNFHHPASSRAQAEAKLLILTTSISPSLRIDLKNILGDEQRPSALSKPEGRV
ncbi:hypothetical protein O181_075693 [Austropuccinia psidii MF-1]|uniref:Uncharacterized protein n=1 Tax=Austropuccinia psidii MF-1 TaxID=1389203 RepID=A0A9Q3FDI3_9BASI|nr:hypothetical protein [Austropuccinia psidii MF-1]